MNVNVFQIDQLLKKEELRNVSSKSEDAPEEQKSV